MIGKRFKKNNPTISFHILYFKEKEVRLAYILKINSNGGKRKLY